MTWMMQDFFTRLVLTVSSSFRCDLNDISWFLALPMVCGLGWLTPFGTLCQFHLQRSMVMTGTTGYLGFIVTGVVRGIGIK
jgi:hypothetical protein